MNKLFLIPLLLVLILGLSVPSALAQAMGTVKGVCKDLEGKPIVGGEVEWMGVDTGRKYTLKTNNKGEYFSLGISPGKYNVKLSKDGKELFHFGNVPVTVDEKELDFDLKKEQSAAAQGQGLTPEQQKAMQEQQAKVAKEKSTVTQ